MPINGSDSGTASVPLGSYPCCSMEDVAMSTMFDVEPLWRSGIGFDHLFDMLGQAVPAKYPPYNIEQTGDDAYRLTVALAGWTPNEVSVTTEPNLLVISGEKAEPEDKKYLYRGIPAVGFEHRFSVAEYIQVRP